MDTPPSILSTLCDSDIEQNKSPSRVVFEFKIDGMTCVACSSAIEKGLTLEFKNKGLIYDTTKHKYEVNVALLMHKMRIIFDEESLNKHNIDSDAIVSEVEDLGFDASFLNKFQMVDEQAEACKQSSDVKPLSVS